MLCCASTLGHARVPPEFYNVNHPSPTKGLRRFGVEQRAKLQSKNCPPPHVLAMTATPIPRTLSLVAHGDMALCAIDEMPPGRTPVATYVLRDTAANREQVCH